MTVLTPISGWGHHLEAPPTPEEYERAKQDYIRKLPPGTQLPPDVFVPPPTPEEFERLAEENDQAILRLPDCPSDEEATATAQQEMAKRGQKQPTVQERIEHSPANP